MSDRVTTLIADFVSREQVRVYLEEQIQQLSFMKQFAVEKDLIVIDAEIDRLLQTHHALCQCGDLIN